MHTISARLLLFPLVSLLAATLVAGCSKKQAASGDANAVSNASPTESSAAAPPGPPSRGPGPVTPRTGAVIADSGDVNATLNKLSLELRRYVVGTRSVPKDYEEFAAKSHVQAPPPPPGQKYAIKDQAVVLVKR